MPGNVSAIEGGFEYQWLYGWFRVLDLLNPVGKIESVAIEDPDAGHFDDITLRPRADTSHAAEFLQVKFHVVLSDFYSSASIASLGLLRKAWRTWMALRDEFDSVELVLVTTWAWDPKDVVQIGDRKLSKDFIDATTSNADAIAARGAWLTALENPAEAEFVPFLRSLRFRLSYDEKTELVDRIRERMGYLGLRTDDDALRAGSDQVRQWVIERTGRITATDLDSAIERLNLRTETLEPSVALYLHTIRKAPSETGADYELDWREAFEGTDRERGHLLHDQTNWNGKLLPELEALANRIENDSNAQFLRVRGPCPAVTVVRGGIHLPGNYRLGHRNRRVRDPMAYRRSAQRQFPDS